MASWAEFEAADGTLAGLVKTSFDAGRHKTMATIRADGGPRISGTETQLIAGDLWLGSMPGARKVVDLLRDPRIAIHSASPDPDPEDHTDWVGDAKISGRAVHIGEGPDRQRYLEGLRDIYPELAGEEDDDPAEAFDLFRIDIAEVVATRIGEPADHLVLTIWSEDRGSRTVTR